MNHRPIVPIVTASALFAVLAGCVANNPTTGADGSTTVTVESSATACTLSTDTAPSGTITFTVTNTGDEVTEFYLLADDSIRVVGEVENVGPGIERKLVLKATPGIYYTACKPGMIGDGIGVQEFTVTDSGLDLGLDSDTGALIDAATASYAEYVEHEVDELVEGTEAFADAYVAGDDDAARALYAPTRVHWERIETVAESFGDLDPRMDLREADLEPGQAWTGWHAIEKDLWPQDAEPGFTAYTQAEREALAEQLVVDTSILHTKAHDLDFSLDQLANGAIGLLDEVASGKVTGEEEFWSHTDLWDFQANIDGAAVLVSTLREVLTEKDPALANTLESEFAQLQGLLDTHRVGDGFRLYTELSDEQIRALSDQVNALAEPLSRLTGALLG